MSRALFPCHQTACLHGVESSGSQCHMTLSRLTCMNVTTDPLTLQVYVDSRESHRMYLETVKLCDFYFKKINV